MSDENYMTRLKANLGKLKRNLAQMSDEQKVQYKKALLKIESDIRRDAQTLYNEFLGMGRRFLVGDNETEEYKNHALEITKCCNVAEKAGFKKDAFDFLFKTFDVDLFVTSLCPLHTLIWLGAYGKKYWVWKVKDTGENNAPMRYYQPLLDMWWHDEFNEWVTLSEVDGKREWTCPVTIMIPPTLGKIDKEIEDEFLHFRQGSFKEKVPWIFDSKYKEAFPLLFEKPLEMQQISLFDNGKETVQ